MRRRIRGQRSATTGHGRRLPGPERRRTPGPTDDVPGRPVWRQPPVKKCNAFVTRVSNARWRLDHRAGPPGHAWRQPPSRECHGVVAEDARRGPRRPPSGREARVHALQRVDRVADVVVGVRGRERQRQHLRACALGDGTVRAEAVAVPRQPVHGQEVDARRDQLVRERALVVVARRAGALARRCARRRGEARACRAGRARAA